MFYTGKYDFLFDNPCSELTDNASGELRHKNVKNYRTKTIKSGDVLECEIFPVLKSYGEIRKAKERVTRTAQKNLNDRNAKKNLTRKIDANFTSADLHVTLTYSGNHLPDEKEAKRDMRNFLQRIRGYRKRHGMSELKYAYVIEFGNGDGRRKRIHHHVIMSGMDRSAVKKLWKPGSVRVDELEPENGSLEGLARYITKQYSGGISSSRRWECSRNLKKPTVTVSESKVSKREAEKITVEFEKSAAVIFTKKFPDYIFSECVVKKSDVFPGVYIYAKMYKEEGGIKLYSYESEEQKCLFSWAALMARAHPELALLYHIPNGGKRSVTTAKRLKAEGVKAGVPDLCLPVARGKYHGLYIELKAGKNKTTDNQNKWLSDLKRNGYRAEVCYGWNNAVEVIKQYLNLQGE